MREQFLINITPQETRVAILQSGQVQEVHIERSANRGLVGNVYLGRVVRVLPGMQSAFVEVGLSRTAFLHVADIWVQRGQGECAQPIERMLSEGQSLIVQVLKDPIGSKGARLTTQISIAGRLLVYLPQDKHIGISQRIDSEAGREALRERLQHLLPSEETGGYIVRTAAEEADDDELLADIHYLRRAWQELQALSARVQPPCLLYEDLDLGKRMLRDLVSPETTRIVVDSRENHLRLKHFAEEYMPQVAPLIDHYVGERPMFDLYGVEDEIEKALSRRVELKSGGYLVVDQTEALTTIDVNTGAFVGQRRFDDTIFKTNLEAAQAIARQLRLRNLGGIILIDFIDMGSAEHRETVLSEFRRALSHDRTRITVNGFTQLGLVEMTRKRSRESLAQMLCEPCGVCSGRGQVKTARTVCYEILRELVREARQFNAREFRVLASPAVIDLFLDEESQALAMLSDFIAKPISLKPESGYLQEQFDIVLM